MGCPVGGADVTQQQQQLGVQQSNIAMPQVKQHGGDALGSCEIV
jgi:hypothetical protein